MRRRARKAATCRCRAGRDGMSQRGSRRSPARRQGRRRARRPRSVHASARGFMTGGWARSGRPRTRCPPSTPTHDEAQGSRPRRGRGGAVRSSTAAVAYARGKGQGSTWPPRDRYARAGVHGNAGVGLAERCVRAQAQTRTRLARRGAAGSTTGIARRTRRHKTARLKKRRARVGEGGGTCKKVHPSLAPWPASPAAARRRGAFHSGSLAVASTRGKQRSSSPPWLLAEV
jgi:hypothetical protein